MRINKQELADRMDELISAYMQEANKQEVDADKLLMLTSRVAYVLTINS